MKLAEKIKQEIERLSCPVHDIYPIVQLYGEDVQVITCCCIFQKQCTEEVEAMLIPADQSIRWDVV